MPKTLKEFIAENTGPLDEVKDLFRLSDVRKATVPDMSRIGSPSPQTGETERNIIRHHLRHSLGVDDVRIERRERADPFPDLMVDPVNPINMPAAALSKVKSLGLQAHHPIVFHISHTPSRTSNSEEQRKIKTHQQFGELISKTLEDLGVPHVVNHTASDWNGLDMLDMKASVSLPADYVAHVIKHVKKNAARTRLPRAIQHIKGDYPWILGDRYAPKEVYTDIPPYVPPIKESEQLFESKKPFISVKLIQPGGTRYRVISSTLDTIKSGDELSDSEFQELADGHPHDVHVENLSKKGSGPGHSSRVTEEMADDRPTVKNHTLMYDALSGKVHYTTDNRFKVGETLTPNELKRFHASVGVSKHQPTSAELELLPSNVEGSYGKLTVARYRAT